MPKIAEIALIVDGKREANRTQNLRAMKDSLMKRIAIIAALAAATLTALGTTANAQTVVFDNGNPNLVSVAASDSAVNQFAADTFTLTGTTPVGTVRWFGVYISANTLTPDAFTVSFFNTTGGTPNATARTGETFAVGNPGRVANGQNIEGIPVYRYEATLSAPVTLSAGTFGISIVNNTTTDVDDDWYWATSSSASQASFSRNAPTTTFGPAANDLAFQLVSAPAAVVPEAGTLALVLPALGMVGAVVRRKARFIKA